MVVTITVPDEVYQSYLAHNPSNPRQAILKQLERFAAVPTGKRILVLANEDLRVLEALYGVPIENADTLVKWATALTALRIGEMEVPLREGQRKRLTAEAGFYKREAGEYVREQVKKAIDEKMGAY